MSSAVLGNETMILRCKYPDKQGGWVKSIRSQFHLQIENSIPNL